MSCRKNCDCGGSPCAGEVGNTDLWLSVLEEEGGFPQEGLGLQQEGCLELPSPRGLCIAHMPPSEKALCLWNEASPAAQAQAGQGGDSARGCTCPCEAREELMGWERLT